MPEIPEFEAVSMPSTWSSEPREAFENTLASVIADGQVNKEEAQELLGRLESEKSGILLASQQERINFAREHFPREQIQRLQELIASSHIGEKALQADGLFGDKSLAALRNRASEAVAAAHIPQDSPDSRESREATEQRVLTEFTAGLPTDVTALPAYIATFAMKYEQAGENDNLSLTFSKMLYLQMDLAVDTIQAMKGAGWTREEVQNIFTGDASSAPLTPEEQVRYLEIAREFKGHTGTLPRSQEGIREQLTSVLASKTPEERGIIGRWLQQEIQSDTMPSVAKVIATKYTQQIWDQFV